MFINPLYCKYVYWTCKLHILQKFKGRKKKTERQNNTLNGSMFLSEPKKKKYSQG